MSIFNQWWFTVPWPSQPSTSQVGNNSGSTAEFARASVDEFRSNSRTTRGRFGEGNTWRWRKGVSGNPRGRPRKPNELKYWEMVTDHSAQIHDLQRRFPIQRDSRFEKFKVIFDLTGNAFRSARLAGYGLKTAKSKGYLLARRARQSTGLG